MPISRNPVAYSYNNAVRNIVDEVARSVGVQNLQMRDMDVVSLDLPTNNPFSVFDSAVLTQSTIDKKEGLSMYDKVAEIILGEDFPRPSFPNKVDNYHNLLENYQRHAEHKEGWIFNRREREGFNRRNIGLFVLDDVKKKMDKRKSPHHLDNENSQFYDWILGGTDWILRLELYSKDEYQFLICRFLHGASQQEIKYSINFWHNDEKFVRVADVWADGHNNDERVKRRFSSIGNFNIGFLYLHDDEDEDIERDWDCEDDD